MAPLTGQIGWVDLATTDVEAARAFYEGLFGWRSRVMPTDVGVDYTMFTSDGRTVAGMAPQPPGMPAGTPSTWNAYVMVDDVDAACAAAEVAGGFVAMPAMDVMTQGRMAMVGDPAGAVLGMWQPGQHRGAELRGAPGSVGWNELQTRGLDAALPFYSAVFGWSWEQDETTGYWIATLPELGDGESMVAGAMTMPDAVPAEVPSVWLVYFDVDDCDEAFSHALELGATAAFEPMTMGPIRFAGLLDPTGAMFMVDHMDEPEPA